MRGKQTAHGAFEHHSGYPAREPVIENMPASDLLYVGPTTTKKLYNYGINSIGDLATAPYDLLARRFGK